MLWILCCMSFPEKKIRTELINKLRFKKVKQRQSDSSQKTEQLSKVEEYCNTEEQEPQQ